jgi:predicted transcriptional regulator YdeE
MEKYMSVINHGVIDLTEKVICGVSVEIFSIMIADKYDPKLIPNAWQKFWKEFPKDSMPTDSNAYGVSFPIEKEPGKLQYFAGVEVTPGFTPPTGFEICQIPAGKYLNLEHVGNISNLAPSYGQAYGVEFPKSGLEMRSAPHLELYDSNLNPMDDNYSMGILIPVN